MLATNAAYAENIAAAVLEGDLTDQNGQRIGDGLRTVLKDIISRTTTNIGHSANTLL